MNIPHISDQLASEYQTYTPNEKQWFWNTLFWKMWPYGPPNWPIMLDEFQEMIQHVEPDFVRFIPGIIGVSQIFSKFPTNLNEMIYIPENEQEKIFSLLRTHGKATGTEKATETLIENTRKDNERFHRPLTPGQLEVLKKREDLEYARLKKVGRESNFWTKIVLDAHHNKLLPLDFDTFRESYSILWDIDEETIIIDMCGAFAKQINKNARTYDVFTFSEEDKKKWSNLDEFLDGMLDFAKDIAQRNGWDFDE